MIAVTDLTVVMVNGEQPRRILSNVSCSFSAGALSLVVGPSGSGKSTLLAVLGGLLRPTHGRLTLDGRDVYALSDRERSRLRLDHIGYVFQSFRLFDSLSAFENVEISLRLQGAVGEDSRRMVQHALASVNLGGRGSESVQRFSGGERQRIAIARALVKKPSIILADEPTAALDGAAGRSIVSLLHGLSRTQRCAVVVVTHDHRMFDFADHMIRLEDGALVEDARSAARLS
jgi:putative ABC transport system ATP-binding protein